MKETRGKSAAVFYILAVAGIIISILTELEKYSDVVRALCGGDTGGCQEVANSSFSTLFGIPLGYWGIASYLVWIVIYRKRKELAGLYGGVLLGAEFHFVYLQIYVIEAICPLCMAQFAVVAAINVLLFATAYPPPKAMKYRISLVPIVLASFLAFYVPMKVEASRAGTEAGDASLTKITSWGDPTSPVTIETFANYECSHCARFEPVMKRVMNDYPDVHIIFRDFLFSHSRYSSMAIAYAGSIAYFEGREMYFKVRFELFENQKRLLGFLQSRLDYMKDDKTMQEAVNSKLAADMKRAKSLGVSSTPITLIFKNGKVVKKITGYVPYERMKEALDKVLGR